MLLLSTILINIFFIVEIEAKEIFNQKYTELRSDVKEWKYQVINGRLYKRLWNSTKQCWETDWIPV